MVEIKRRSIVIWIFLALALIPAAYAPLWYGSGDDTGLVLRMSCEGNFLDGSGQGNHGTQSGGVKITSGTKGRGCGFDGNDDSIIVTHASSLSLKNVTISAWVKPSVNTMGAGNVVVGKGSYNYLLYFAGTSDNSPMMYMTGLTPISVTATTNLVAGNWYHLAAKYDSTTTNMTIYVNGVQENTINTSGTPTTNSNNLGIGAGTAGLYTFNGTIDEVRIYNRSLSAAEIYSLYNTTKTYKIQLYTTPVKAELNDTPAPTINDETGLVGYWKMDDYSGGTTTDSGPYGYHGTPTDDNATNDGAIPPNFTTGRWSSGFLFDGVDDAIKLPNNNIAGATNNFTISAWVYSKSISSTQVIYGEYAGSTGSTRNLMSITNSKLIFDQYEPSGTNFNSSYGTALQSNRWYHLAVVGNTTHYITYIDSARDRTAAQETYTSSAPTSAFIGARNNTASDSGLTAVFKGYIDEVRIYNRTLSDSEIKELYLSKGIVGKWTMDASDKNSTDAYDSSGYYNHGKITGATLTNEGKFKEGMKYDGSSDYINCGNDSSVEMGTRNMSISVWFKPANKTYSGYIINNGVSTGDWYALYHSDTGRLIGAIGKEGSYALAYTAQNHFTPNRWYHAVLTYNRTENLTLYIDGALVNYAEAIQNISGYAENSITSKKLYIGSYDGGAGSFNGTLDEVRIYNRVLSATEVAALYNGTKTNHIELWTTPTLGGLNETPAPTITDETELRGYWKLDGNIQDSSGQSNHGTAIDTNTSNSDGDTPPSTTAARWNNGYQFDGIDDFISVPDTASIELSPNITISAWINIKSLAASGAPNIIQRFNAGASNRIFRLAPYYSSATARYVQFYVDDNGGDFNSNYSFVDTTNLNFDQWHHVVALKNGTTCMIYINGAYSSQKTNCPATVDTSKSQPLEIGRRNDTTTLNYFNGTIDEVRIYNRSLSADEVKELYLSKGLVGHWKMDADQKNSTHIYDTSGYDNYGAVSGAVLTNDGRFKEGMKFDGIDDYISMGTGASLNTNQTTITAWVKPAASPQTGYDRIIEKVYTNSYYLGFDTTGTKFKGIFANTTSPYGSLDSTTTIQTNKWYHIAVTHDGTNDCLYVNGVQEATQANPVALSNSTSPVYISKYTVSGGYFFNGTIDEVRIYNRALSATEIGQLYNGTKTNRISLWSIPG